MRRDAFGGGQDGFTLLEVMVTLVAFGLLLVGLAQGGQFGLAAWRAQEGGGRRLAELEAVDRTLRGLIAQAHPGTEAEAPAFDGRPGGMVFRSVLPQAALAGGRGIDAVLGLDAARALVLRWAPRGGGEGAEERLLAGLDRIEFAYWQPPAAGVPGQWLRSWRAPVLPGLIRVRLVFPAGDRRHWPDIVASPLRERPA